MGLPSLGLGAESRQQSRPNIIFILSDDHAVGAISAYGSRINQTPNLDRLAKEGMRFTQALGVQSLCAPARANLLTGKHCHANGVVDNHTRFDGSQQTFPKLLQAAGYETAIVGKWHLKSLPTGFDHYQILKGQGRYFDCPLITKGHKKPVMHKGYLTDVITDRAVEWLKGRESDRPFCLMVHHKAPHAPFLHKEEHARLFEKQTMPEPATLLDDWLTRLPLQAGHHANTKLAHCCWKQYRQLMKTLPEEKEERTRQIYQVTIKGYLRLIASLDENVGRLLDYVEGAGLRDNTIVVYASDNGFFMGEHGLYNKMWMYDQSLQIPLMVRYPGTVKPGTTNDDLVTMVDLAPTLLDLAGEPIPRDMHGRSIRPLLAGHTPDDWQKAAYYHYYGDYDVPEHVGVRSQTHKLIFFPTFKHDAGPYWEYFDLRGDPSELRNVYDREKNDPAVLDLKRQLLELSKRYGRPGELKPKAK